ncbi:MAG: HAMP domain-containing sensor histidine kinase [Burkholderiales bacterium]
MRLRDLSLRYKIPLRGSILIVVTAIVVSAALVAREYDDFKRDLVETADAMGRVLAHTLVAPLVHDDVWRAYEIITSPSQTGVRADSPLAAEWLAIVDPQLRIYVSSRADRFPVLAEVATAIPDPLPLVEELRSRSQSAPRLVDRKDTQHLYMLTPIAADGVLLGTLVAAYSRDIFLPRLRGIIEQAALVALAVLAIVITASWYWAQRFAAPLVDLAERMSGVGRADPAVATLQLEESKDEIGRLATAFREMLAGLRDKAEFERQIIHSERLAALGRLSAGIAHEINNPLGGMLNAIDTFRRHGNGDPMTLKTIALLERGLTQIRETVAALLVEARFAAHPLAPQDIEDVRTLVLADAHRMQARLEWDNRLGEDVPLPSTAVRQILINLLLNAFRAVDSGGRVSCAVERAHGALRIVVGNDGAHIPAERLDHLFEPFARSESGGHGLGLWVTYQIVQQLGGRISARSFPGDTRFEVGLPLEGAA